MGAPLMDLTMESKDLEVPINQTVTGYPPSRYDGIAKTGFHVLTLRYPLDILDIWVFEVTFSITMWDSSDPAPILYLIYENQIL